MPLIVTRQSHAARKQMETELKSRKRNATEEKKIAWEQGDLRENAGFAEAKRDIALTGRRLADLGLDRTDLQIIDPKEWIDIDMMGEPNAQVGSVISIQRDANPTHENYIIGGAWDGDLAEVPVKWDMQPKRLPYTSPLARLLIPHDVGFKGVLETSGEAIKLVSARPPTKAEIEHIYPPIQTKEKKDEGMTM